ncbi:MAG: FG-GAP-like repeat-containing protein [Planctomycetota bacterium]
MDHDGDGIQDFISGSYDPGDVYLFRGLGKGEYAKGEVLVDEDGTPLVHHPREYQEYQRFEAAGDTESDEAVQAMISSFGSWAAPVDWESDGDLDILIGSFGGRLYLRENIGTRKEPVYSRESVAIESAGKPLQVKGHNNPVVADWDGDGRWDLVVGSSDGSVQWYRNVGTAEAPEFGGGLELVRAKSDMKFMFQYLLPGAAPRPAVRAQICVTDYDGDGAMDLIVGDYSDVGTLREDADIVDLDALAVEIDAMYAERTIKGQAEVTKGFRDHFTEPTQYSSVWLYRRTTSGSEQGAAAAAVAVAVDVPTETPTNKAPVKLGVGIDGVDAMPAVGATFDIVVRLRTATGWHVYDLDGPDMYADTELELDLPDGLEAAGEWNAPESKPYGDGLRIWEGDVAFTHSVRVVSAPEPGAEIGVTVAYQTCNAEMCYPPTSKALTVALADAGGDDATAWAPHRSTRVLYAGSEGGHRETEFSKFLAEHFDVTATLPLEELSMATAEDYDVVVIDWKSQYGLDGYDKKSGLHRVPVALGPGFTKPVIAMSYVGTKARRGQKLDWL